MFGGMFGGVGGGGSALRKVRVGALAVFVVLGFALRRNGSAYNTVHAMYFVVIAALVVASIAMRGRGHHGYRPPGGAPGGRGSFGPGPPPPGLPGDNPDPDPDPGPQSGP